MAVNGITTAEVDSSRRPELSDLPRSGYISLENIRGKGRGVEYRAIRVEELNSSPYDPAEDVTVPRGGADPVVGRWQTDRGTQAVPSVWEFRGDGSLVYERYGMKAFGRWSRQGDRIVAGTTSDDSRLSIQKWFTIASQGRGYMDVVMEGTRPYTWRRLDLPLGESP